MRPQHSPHLLHGLAGGSRRKRRCLLPAASLPKHTDGHTLVHPADWPTLLAADLRLQGFWLNRGRCDWPVNTLQLGSVTYNKDQMLQIMELASGNLGKVSRPGCRHGRRPAAGVGPACGGGTLPQHRVPRAHAVTSIDDVTALPSLVPPAPHARTHTHMHSHKTHSSSRFTWASARFSDCSYCDESRGLSTSE